MKLRFYKHFVPMGRGNNLRNLRMILLGAARSTRIRIAQLIVVLLIALTLKLAYSTASPNQLRWILAPTTVLVELVSGTLFTFESHAGYLSGDRSFLIAASCAGVNFLITSFLMLSLSKLWRDRSQGRSQNHPQAIPWLFIPAALLFAYLATIVANAVRISTALQLKLTPLEISWLSPNQLHRFEGIFIYFGFLLLLFILSERSWEKDSEPEKLDAQSPAAPSSIPLIPGEFATASGSRNALNLLRQFVFPLSIYYATTLGIPLARGVYRQGAEFWEHSLFVLLTPLILILPLATFRFSLARFRSYKTIP